MKGAPRLAAAHGAHAGRRPAAPPPSRTLTCPGRGPSSDRRLRLPARPRSDKPGRCLAPCAREAAHFLTVARERRLGRLRRRATLKPRIIAAGLVECVADDGIGAGGTLTTADDLLRRTRVQHVQTAVTIGRVRSRFIYTPFIRLALLPVHVIRPDLETVMDWCGNRRALLRLFLTTLSL